MKTVVRPLVPGLSGGMVASWMASASGLWMRGGCYVGDFHGEDGVGDGLRWLDFIWVELLARCVCLRLRAVPVDVFRSRPKGGEDQQDDAAD